MGVYGMLAVGFAFFAMRYLIPAEKWSERLAKTSFWSLNIGLAWMSFVSLLPLGILQLYHSVDVGYFDARSLKFIGNDTNALFEWLRLPGDVLFIVGGVLPLLWMSLQGVIGVLRTRGQGPVDDDGHDVDDLQLFTEVGAHEPAEATAAGALT
jgi:nitric oxide reductase subunit B